jgi:biopolymer transport protein ExbD
MQLSHRKKSGPTVELQMTSMIDVTFLLLIFFMITSSFHKTERELDPQVKVNKQAPTQSASANERPIIDLVPSDNGSGYVMKLGGRTFSQGTDLVKVLQLLENKQEGAIVRVPHQAPYELAAAAIQACKTAGFQQVSYVPKVD